MRRGPGGSEAVPGLQRQHQHLVVAVDAGHRRLLRRLDPGPTRTRTRCRHLPRDGTASRADHRRTARGHRPGPVRGLRKGLGRPSGTAPEYGDREPTEPWAWAGPACSVTGRTWGGCIDVIQSILTAGRFPQDPSVLHGGVLLLESSEDLIPAQEFGFILRSLGERGVLDAVDAVLVARPPASSFTRMPDPAGRAAHRQAQRDTAIETVQQYNPGAVICARSALRAHPTTVDPPLRRHGHRQRCQPERLGRLQLTTSEVPLSRSKGRRD